MLHQRDENFMMLTSWKTGSRENRAYTEAWKQESSRQRVCGMYLHVFLGTQTCTPAHDMQIFCVSVCNEWNALRCRGRLFPAKSTYTTCPQSSGDILGLKVRRHVEAARMAGRGQITKSSDAMFKSLAFIEHKCKCNS